MSQKEFQDGCEGCKPALIDTTTMKPVPDDDPLMLAINAVWNATTIEERKAFHEVTCLNSREPQVMNLALGIVKRFEMAAKALESEN